MVEFSTTSVNSCGTIVGGNLFTCWHSYKNRFGPNWCKTYARRSKMYIETTYKKCIKSYMHIMFGHSISLGTHTSFFVYWQYYFHIHMIPRPNTDIYFSWLVRYSRCWPLSTFLFDGSKGRRILSTSSSPTGAAGLLAGLTVGLILVLFEFGERGLSILLFPNKWKTSKHVLAGAFILLYWNWLNQIMENYSSTIRAFRYYIYIYIFICMQRERAIFLCQMVLYCLVILLCFIFCLLILLKLGLLALHSPTMG